MDRRKFGQALVGFVSTLTIPFKAFSKSKRFPELPTFWYEDKDGNKWIPPKNFDNPNNISEDFIYQHSRFPLEVSHTIYGPEGKVGTFNTTTRNEKLILALVKDGYSLEQSMLIYSIACERCMNVIGHDYGLEGYYDKNSLDYKKSNTSCEFCETKDKI